PFYLLRNFATEPKKVYDGLQNTLIVEVAMNNCCNSLYIEKMKFGCFKLHFCLYIPLIVCQA
ncbi:TPA: hypothetical protein ACGXQD_005835, partial [Bacillus cereus]